MRNLLFERQEEGQFLKFLRNLPNLVSLSIVG